MKITISKKYLVIPVNNVAREKRLVFRDVNGDIALEFSVPLDVSMPKFFSYINVSRFLGCELDVTVDPDAVFDFSFSDSMPDEDPSNCRRPYVHYTPKTGWLSDPNGLCCIGGKYHIFYQYNPGSTMWGNMHWGHAVSEDLMHWTELDPALYPDSSGAVFSGSAYIGSENVSGLKKSADDPDPVLLFYTAAGGISEQSKGKLFTQCLAYSTDGGVTFEKYGKNPILDHFKADNRDPKVSWAPELRKYVMVLYIEENRYAIFTSENLLDWTELQKITLPNDINCPDFYPLRGDDGERLWVFSGGSDYYTIGRLTQEGFVSVQNVRPFHFGENCSCAGQTFAFPASRECGSMYERRIRMVYERMHMSDAPFENQLGIPAEMSLVRLGNIYRLRSLPVKEIESLYSGCVSEENIVLRAGAAKSIPLSSRAYDITFSGNMNNGRFRVTLFGINILIQPDKNKMIVENHNASVNDMPLSYSGKGINVRIIADVAGIEIFADDGLVYSTAAIPADFGMPYIRFEAQSDSVIERMCAHRLENIKNIPAAT